MFGTPTRRNTPTGPPMLGRKRRRVGLISRRSVKRYQRRVNRRYQRVKRYQLRVNRRYSRRRRIMRPRVTWSRPDTYRFVNGTFTIGSAATETAAAARTQKWSISYLYVNPIYTADGLGNHGFFDIVGLETESATGAFNLQTNASVRLRNASMRNGLVWRHNKQIFSLHFTPDWQTQAVPDDTGDTPVYASSAKMVIRPFMLIAKKRMPFIDVLPTESTNAAVSTQPVGSITVDETLDTTLETSDTFIRGWLSKFTAGLVKRYGPTSNFTGLTTTGTPTPRVFRPTAGTNPQTSTGLPASTLCFDGVKLEDSIDLYRDFIIRRMKPFVIKPGESATRRYRMPPVTYSSASMEVELPININATDGSQRSITNVGYFPKGYAILGFMAQVTSNKANETTRVPVTFKNQYTYSTAVTVKGSTLGGNINISSGFTPSINMLPANPVRLIAQNNPT